ncbi:splicing factor, proline- and glutamine-rich-like isoform X2 [Hemicordylus capensis]|uniref:splicing factor, proline- and glutamine-rich-like isoform X2 n=1 Tax=Hemicordylus capensis TaxID=884348 RepID=UPI002303FE56|nr:splicing factor, proline- and glutamine-rich-like isoform X2 [Hemicordylus capensis]
MERMEVEPSAGGGALRRSNSAPQLPGPAGTPPLEQLPGPQRSRRSSVCLDSGLAAVEAMETLPKDLTPASSSSPPATVLGPPTPAGTSTGPPALEAEEAPPGWKPLRGKEAWTLTLPPRSCSWLGSP